MIYENCTIITMDAHRRIITDGALAVRDGRIAASETAQRSTANSRMIPGRWTCTGCW